MRLILQLIIGFALSGAFQTLKAQTQVQQCENSLQAAQTYCENTFGVSNPVGFHTKRIQWPTTYYPDGSTVINITMLCYYDPMSVDSNRVYAQECYITTPGNPQPPPSPPPDPPLCQEGSVIRVEEGSVAESVAIVGTPFRLVYTSERTLGNAKAYKLPLVAPASAFYVGSNFTVNYANGRQNSFSLNTGQSTSFVWDGKDASNVYLESPTRADVDTVTVYSSGPDLPIRTSYSVGTWNVVAMGLGGWNFDVHHLLDLTSNKIYKGDGSINTDIVTTMIDPSTYRVVARGDNEVYYFDLNGKHLTTNEIRTNAVKLTFNYLTNGKLSSIVDSYGNTTSITRNGSGDATGIQAPFGQITSLGIGTDGYLAWIQNPKSETHSMTYYPGGLLHTFQKPKGQISTMSYDSEGNLTLDSSSAGNFTSIALSVTGFNKVITVSDALGVKSTTDLNQVNGTFARIHNVRTTENSTTSYNPTDGFSLNQNNAEQSGSITYRNDSRFGVFLMTPTAVKDVTRTVSGVNTSSTTYLQSVVNTSSTPTPFNYDSLESSTIVNGKTTVSTYLRASGVETVQTPANRYRYITTDAYGKIISEQNANFLPTQYTYDTFGRLKFITQGTRQSEIQYNSLGYVQSVKNPLNQTTSYTYDLAGQIQTKTLPDLRVVTYNHDANGNTIEITPPNSGLHDFDFNAFDLPEYYTPPTVPTSTPSTHYVYDNAKRITQIVKPDSSVVNYYYDPTTTLLTSVAVSGDTTQFTLSPNGSISSATSQDGILINQSIMAEFFLNSTTYNSANVNIGAVSYIYNTDMKPSSFTISSQGSAGSTFNYTYDDDGILNSVGAMGISIDATTGLKTKTTLNRIQEAYSYDSSYGEPLSLSVHYVPTTGTSTPLFSQNYIRDSLGRLHTKTETVGATTNQFVYTYDIAGRLTDVTKNGVAYSHYNFINNSNANSGNVGGVAFTATYDAQDRILTYNTTTNTSFTYTLNGEMKTKKVGSTTTTYTWNGFGMLKTAKVGSGATITYLYDGLNRLVGRKSGSTIQKYWVYQDQLRIAAEVNASGTITKRFIYGTKPNVPDYMISGTTTYKIISDHLGSVRLVVNAATGAIAQKIEYNERGAVISDTSAGFQPFYFAGGLYDTTTKLLHFGARDYDPCIGRWLSKDPILFKGGDTNLYGYVLNDPVNGIDPNGLARSDDRIDVGTGGGTVSPFPIPVPIPPISPPNCPDDNDGKRKCGPERMACFLDCASEEYRNNHQGLQGQCFDRCADEYIMCVQQGGLP